MKHVCACVCRGLLGVRKESSYQQFSETSSCFSAINYSSGNPLSNLLWDMKKNREEPPGEGLAHPGSKNNYHATCFAFSFPGSLFLTSLHHEQTCNFLFHLRISAQCLFYLQTEAAAECDLFPSPVALRWAHSIVFQLRWWVQKGGIKDQSFDGK